MPVATCFLHYEQSGSDACDHEFAEVGFCPALKMDVGETTSKISTRTYFDQFCNQTSIHGWPYLASESGVIRKGLWLAAILATSGWALYFMRENIVEYRNSDVVTLLNTTTASLSEIYFPTVTVCNVNQVSQAFLSSIDIDIKDEEVTKMLFSQFIDGDPKVFEKYAGAGESNPKFDENLKKLQPTMDLVKQTYGWSEFKSSRPPNGTFQSASFAALASQNCSGLILYAEWKRSVSHSFYSTHVGTTDYGICCTIVPYLDFENSRTVDLPPSMYTAGDFMSVPRGAKNGLQNGLKLILDVEGFDYAYFSRGAKGAKLVLSDHRDKAVVNQDGFYVAPGAEKLIAVVPEVLNTTEDALDMRADLRGCYTDAEFDFRYMRYNMGYISSMKNCLYESVLEMIIKNCSCKPAFVNFNIDQNLPSCRGEKLGCTQYWMDRFGSEFDPDLTGANTISGKTYKCRQRCEHQYYNVLATSSAYPNYNVHPYRADYCLIMVKVYRVCQNQYQREQLEGRYNKYQGLCNKIARLVGNDKASLCNISSPNEQPTYEMETDIQHFIQEYSEQNIAVVKIYLKDPYYTNIKRDVAMTFTSFIGTAGGLVGLCVGLSFISVFELFYQFFNSCIIHLSNGSRVNNA